MAYERKTIEKVRGDSLDSFISNVSKTFSDQVVARNAADELGFHQAVLENNLSLDDQLKYRQNQLKDVADDPSERIRVKSEISSLKDRIEQKTFTDAYLQKLTDQAAGRASIDAVISWLTDQKTAATDQTIIDSINKELLTQTQNQFTMTKNMLMDQTNYALNDKTNAVISAQLAKVSSQRAQALLSGDKSSIASLDLQIQALNKALTENSVAKDIAGLAVQNITGYSTATKLLDSYNAKIAGSAESGPLTVGGTTYASAKEFWTATRDAFVADTSSSGFLPRLKEEVTTTLKTANSNNTLNTGVLQSTTATAFDALASRPELSAYATQIMQTKQATLQGGADLISKEIQNTYATNYDVGQAVTALSALKATGVNVSDGYSNILTAAGQVKQNQVNSILTSAQQLMANDPSMSAEEAINRSVAAGAGTVYSPEQLANTSESKIAKTGAATATAGTGKDNPATTIQPSPAPGSATSSSSISLSNLSNLGPGSSGNDVRTLQQYLIANGYAIKDGATGFYGPETKAAVTALQKANKIDTQGNDGYFGPLTKAAIAKSNSPAPVSTSTPAPATSAPASTPAPAAYTPPAPTPAPQPQSQPQPQNTNNSGGGGSYSTNADYLKVKGGSVGQSGDFGRTPNGIVQLSTGKILP